MCLFSTSARYDRPCLRSFRRGWISHGERSASLPLGFSLRDALKRKTKFLPVVTTFRNLFRGLTSCALTKGTTGKTGPNRTTSSPRLSFDDNKPVVKSLDVQLHGQFVLSLTCDFILAVFQFGAVAEDWCFFRPCTGDRHLVVSGGKIERDET